MEANFAVIDFGAILQNCSHPFRKSADRSGHATLSLLFPPQCELCGSVHSQFGDDSPVCESCRAGLITNHEHTCRRCATPVPASAVAATNCPNCRGAKFKFTESVSLGLYGGVMREAILRMKQPVHEALTMSIGRLLADRIGQRGFARSPDVIVSVPMHWTRRFRRGINQSELLAEVVSQRLRISVCEGILTCSRNIKKQGTLSPEERRRNVRDAFRLSRGYDIKGAHALVVDDVMTTGATANEVARVCRKAGAASVMVATVARAIGAQASRVGKK